MTWGDLGVMLIEDSSAGLLLGLSTGVYCLGWCTLVMVPHLASAESRGLRAGLRKILEFAAGRLIAYAALAALALWVGRSLLASRGARLVTGVLVLLLAALVLAQGVVRSFPTVRWCLRLAERPVLRRYPLLGGLLSGAHLCPPLLLCLTHVATVGSAGRAIAFGGAFFVGTTLLSLPLALVPIAGRWPNVRAAAAVASVFCGLWFAASGLSVVAS